MDRIQEVARRAELAKRATQAHFASDKEPSLADRASAADVPFLLFLLKRLSAVPCSSCSGSGDGDGVGGFCAACKGQGRAVEQAYVSWEREQESIAYWTNAYAKRTDAELIEMDRKNSEDWKESFENHSLANTVSLVLEARGYTYDTTKKEWIKHG
jgi:hypothetical protein